MLKLLKNMRRKEVLMVLLCTVLVAVQVYFDLRLPDYMTDLTTLIKTSGATADILSVGVKMLGCTLVSAVLAVGCGYLAAKAASGFSFAVREKLFRHVMDIGSEEMQDFSVASLITRTTNDITQIQMIVAMGLQMMIKSPIMAVWAVIKILGKSWELSAVTAAFVVVLCVTILTVMSICIPRFRIVQKLTDQINRVARENLTGINVVHAFNAEQYQNDKFNKPSLDMMNVQVKNQKLFALVQPTMTLGMNGLSSRALKDDEKNDVDGTIVALDGIAIIVNKDSKVADLTVEQLKKMFTGEITNWKEVGGDDGEIVLVGREAGSGTRDGFESIVDVKDSCKYAQELTATGAVISAVEANPLAIGYASLSAVGDTVAMVTVEGVECSEDTVKDGSYKIQRPFVFVTNKSAALSEQAQAFVDFATSKDAADLIRTAGAVPVNE